MKQDRKSPIKKMLRKIVPYIICFGIVLAIFAGGFIVGATVPAKADVEQTCSITDEQPPVDIVILETVTPEVEWFEYVATAYCPCEKCCGIWATKRPLDENGEQIVYGATGIVLQQGVSVAADTSVHPMGTQLEIEGIGTYTVQDRGGAIKGNRLDVYFDNHADAAKFGKQTVRVRVVK